MNYTVRLAQIADVPFLADIERAAAQQFLPYLSWLAISTALLEGLTTPGFLLRAQADNRLWVATCGHQVVGFIVIKFLPDICFIVELDVHPDFGRQGIGSALVNACGQSARERGFNQIWLTTFRKIPWNIPFYQRLGFEVMSEDSWTWEIEAIVQHEARYGFARDKRAVMALRYEEALGPDGTGA